MLTKQGEHVKESVDAMFKQHLKDYRHFRKAYMDANIRGASGEEMEDLFFKTFNKHTSEYTPKGAPGSGAGSGSYKTYKGPAKSPFTFKSAFKNFKNQPKNVRRNVGLSAGMLGASALYGLYQQKKNRDRDAQFKKSAASVPLQFAGLGAISGAAGGALQAALLSETEKRQLRKYYNLAPDSNLVLRNMGRGALFGGAGAFAGSNIGGATHGLLGGLVGGGVGTSLGNLASRKYSFANYLDIKKRNKMGAKHRLLRK